MKRLSCLGLLGLLLIGCGEPTADPNAEPATSTGAVVETDTPKADVKLDYISDDAYEKLKADNPLVVVSFSADW